MASESRVRILRLLSGDRLCVGALSRSTGITAGAVSQHLRILRSTGLVEPERRGYFIHYRLAPGAARRLRAALAGVARPDRAKPVCDKSSKCLPVRKSSGRGLVRRKQGRRS